MYYIYGYRHKAEHNIGLVLISFLSVIVIVAMIVVVVVVVVVVIIGIVTPKTLYPLSIIFLPPLFPRPSSSQFPR